MTGVEVNRAVSLGELPHGFLGRRGGVSDQSKDVWEVGVSLPLKRRERSVGSQLGAAVGRQSHR